MIDIMVLRRHSVWNDGFSVYLTLFPVGAIDVFRSVQKELRTHIC